LNQTRRLTIALVFLLITAFVYLLSDFTQQMKKQAVYMERINDQKIALGNLPVPATDLEQKLTELSAENTAASQAVSNNALNTTLILDSLLNLADNNQLTTSPLAADSWTSKTVGEGTYRILPLQIQLQGQLTAFNTFLSQIEDKTKYPSLVVSNVSILPSTDPAAGDNGSIISAKLELELVIRLPDPKAGDNQ
jgi:hypothetical protein